jgi:hypothetical protein
MKHLFITLLIFSVVCIAKADNNVDEGNDLQASGNNGAYRTGEFRISAGTSFFRGGYGLYGYSLARGYGWDRTGMWIPILAKAEYGFDDLFSAGIAVGYFSRGYKTNSTFRHPYTNELRHWEIRQSFTAISGVVNLHLTDFLVNELGFNYDPEKWDFYASANLGVQIHSYYDNWRESRSDWERTNIRFAGALTGGGRYYFTDSFAGYLEFGRGLFGWSTIGLTLRL